MRVAKVLEECLFDPTQCSYRRRPHAPRRAIPTQAIIYQQRVSGREMSPNVLAWTQAPSPPRLQGDTACTRSPMVHLLENSHSLSQRLRYVVVLTHRPSLSSLQSVVEQCVPEFGQRVCRHAPRTLRFPPSYSTRTHAELKNSRARQTAIRRPLMRLSVQQVQA